MTPTPILFAPLLIASLFIFAWGCWRRLGLLSLGTSEDRFDKFGTRLVEMFKYAFAQKRVLAKPFGFNHFVIFWSFLILLVANTEFLLHGVFPQISLARLPEGIYLPLMLTLDIVSAAALAAVIVAAIRRVFAPPFPEARTPEAFFILGLIAILMLAYFGINAAKLARLPENMLAVGRTYMPVSSLFADQISPAATKAVHDISWWFHAIALLLFMNYLPYSKHMHILTAIPNCFFRRLGKPNTVPREEFAVGKKFGVDRVDDFSWKDLLDAFACTECGRCQNVCPGSLTGKPLNPRGIIHDIKNSLLKNGPLLRQGREPQKALIAEGGEEHCCEEAIWAHHLWRLHGGLSRPDRTDAQDHPDAPSSGGN